MNLIWPCFSPDFSFLAQWKSAVQWYSACYDEIIRHEWKGEVITGAVCAIISVTCIISMENVWVGSSPTVCDSVCVCWSHCFHISMFESARVRREWERQRGTHTGRCDLPCGLIDSRWHALRFHAECSLNFLAKEAATKDSSTRG